MPSLFFFKTKLVEKGCVILLGSSSNKNEDKSFLILSLQNLSFPSNNEIKYFAKSLNSRVFEVKIVT